MSAMAWDAAVVLSPYPWAAADGLWQTTHHVARELGRRLPTVYVEPSPSWNPADQYFHLSHLAQAILGESTSAPEPGLTVLRRRTLPLGRMPAIREHGLARAADALRALLARRGYRRVLLWHSFPYWSERLVEAAQPRTLAYHCLDYSPREEEGRLVLAADAVFCVSEALVARHRLANPRTTLLTNGVDLHVYDPERAARAPRPSDLPAHGRIIGFVGSINRHLDVELLDAVARAFPQQTLAVVGRVSGGQTAPSPAQKRALAALRRRPNVRLLGFRAPREVPPYLRAFDACLIPFLDDAFNRDRDPLKFYEYAAMGKPAVATTSPAVTRRYPELCYLGSSHQEFVAAVREALAERERDGDTRARARRAMARAHGWPSVVDHAMRALEAGLAVQGPQAREHVR